MKHLLLITAAAGLVGLGAAAVEAQTLGRVQAQASGVVQPSAPAVQAPGRAHDAHKALEAEASVEADRTRGYVRDADDTRVQGDATAKSRVKADPRGRSRAATVSGARAKARTPAGDATVKSKDRTETEAEPRLY